MTVSWFILWYILASCMVNVQCAYRCISCAQERGRHGQQYSFNLSSNCLPTHTVVLHMFKWLATWHHFIHLGRPRHYQPTDNKIEEADWIDGQRFLPCRLAVSKKSCGRKCCPSKTQHGDKKPDEEKDDCLLPSQQDSPADEQRNAGSKKTIA